MPQPYREGKSSTFTHLNKRYRLDTVLEIVENKQARDVDIADLKWIIKYAKADSKRVETADVKYPIIIIKDKQHGLVVLDGFHRLNKAISLGMKKIPAKIITQQELDTAEIKPGHDKW